MVWFFCVRQCECTLNTSLVKVMQAAGCKQACSASERDHAQSTCRWWIGRSRSDQHQRLLSDSSEFVIVDFNAGVLQLAMMVIAVGYAVFGVQTLRQVGINGNLTEEYKHLHEGSFFVAASLAAAALVLLSVRGPHTPVIARYYQVLGPALMGTLFTLNLVQRSTYELRFALSPQAWPENVSISTAIGFPSAIECVDTDPWATARLPFKTNFGRSCDMRFADGTSIGVQMMYFVVPVAAHFHTRTTAALVTYQWLAMLVAVIANGALLRGRGGAQMMVYFGLLGAWATASAWLRTRKAFAKWRISRQLIIVSDSSRNFLATLIPPHVYALTGPSGPSRGEGELLVHHLPQTVVLFLFARSQCTQTFNQ